MTRMPYQKGNVMNFFCICLARGGSKGIPGKNIKMFCGKPLISYTIEAALASSEIVDIFVSSDSAKILSVSSKFGAKPLERPKGLATDEATSDEAIWYHFNQLYEEKKYDAIILLQPTSPLRTSKDIDSAIEIFKEYKNNVFSVSELEISPLRSYFISENLLHPIIETENASRRQDERKAYVANGAIYIFDSKEFLKTKQISRKNIVPYVMEKRNGIDIDNIIDFQLAELIMKEREKE